MRSDPKLYINFKFCKEKKIIDIEITYCSTKPSNYDDKNNSNKRLHVLEDEQVVCE